MNDHDKELSGQLDRAIREIKEMHIPEESLAGAMAATRDAMSVADMFEDMEEKSGLGKRLKEAVMKYKPFSLAAGIAVLGVATALFLFDRAGAGLAFADVLTEISTLGEFSYSETVQYEGKPDFVRKVVRRNSSSRREIWPDETVKVFDLGQSPNRILTLWPYAKFAQVEILEGTGARRDPDLLTLLSAYEKAAVLGEQTINGRAAEGFHFGDAVNDWTGWFDSTTKLPIRLELLQSEIGRKTIMENFEYGMPLDPSLFSAEIPEGYYSSEMLFPLAFTSTVERNNETISSQRVFQKNWSQRREVLPDGRIVISDMSSQPARILQLFPDEKKSVETIVDVGENASDPDCFQMATNAQGPNGKALGNREISGRDTLGFKYEFPGNEFVCWVDPESRRPVLMEILHVKNGRKIVMSDFEFNVELESNFFDTVIPQGYTVERKNIKR